MKRAWVEIRDKPHYRSEAFEAGLRACGYHVLMRQSPPRDPAPGDVFVIWNRYSTNEQAADRWEAAGGTVLVAENGYCGRDGEDRQYYAIARHGHNGSGTWEAGGAERWERLGLELRPWRAAGEHVLVAPNRHFGMRGLAMPQGWAESVVQQLRRHTRRPVRVRPHPNDSPPVRPLAEDLTGCWAVVIWASSVGVHALLAGVPVIACAPWWICRAAAGADVSTIEAPALPERRPAFERLAWAQWSVDEIAHGEPFRLLLSAAGQGEVAAAV
jgi:hypothetical protein